MNNQPEEITPHHSPQVIAVSSGKGGVGKTFISVHLAARAAKQNKRVLLIDADLGLANVDIMLGLTAKGSILQVIEGQSSLSDILVKGGDYSIDEIVGADQVLARGGEVKRLSFLDEVSTTAIVEKIKDRD